MSFAVNVKFNDTNQIINAHHLDEKGKVAYFATQDVYRLSEPYTPRDSGMLYRNVEIKDNSIKYMAPYAHYQYYGMQMVDKNGSSYAKLGEKKHYSNKPITYHNGGLRGKQWDKRLVADRLNDIISDIQKYIEG